MLPQTNKIDRHKKVHKAYKILNKYLVSIYPSQTIIHLTAICKSVLSREASISIYYFKKVGSLGLGENTFLVLHKWDLAWWLTGYSVVVDRMLLLIHGIVEPRYRKYPTTLGP